MILFIGTPEIIFILIIALLIFGPEKIPEIAKNLGKGIRMLRDTTNNVKREIMKEAYEAGLDKKKLDHTVNKELGQIKKIMDVKEEIEDITKDIKDITGPIKRK